MMKPLSDSGQEFSASIEDKGVRIHYEEGNPILVKWCYWLGAIEILCRNAKEFKDDKCVRVGTTRGWARIDTLEGAAQHFCGSQFSTATWIAKILEALNLVTVCEHRPLAIKLNEEGKDKLCPLMAEPDYFSEDLKEILKDIEKYD